MKRPLLVPDGVELLSGARAVRSPHCLARHLITSLGRTVPLGRCIPLAMAQLLPELKAVKGKRRAYSFFGDGSEGSPRTMKFLTDAKVIKDPDELAEEGKSHRAHEHLVFSNCVANFGKGVLFLEITRWKSDRKTATVRQVIEDDAKPRTAWRRRHAGRAVLDTNPDHNHWHYSDFLSYTLTQFGSRRSRKPAQKQSFCLEDVARLRKNARPRLWEECPDPEAESGEMGITPGWGDVYWSGVQEQFIEVEDLPRGDYWLEMVVDPLKRLKVKSRRNHKTRAKVTLT